VVGLTVVRGFVVAGGVVGRTVVRGAGTEVGTVTLVLGTVVSKVVLGNVESGVFKVVVEMRASPKEVVGLLSITPRAARSSESVRSGSAIDVDVDILMSSTTTMTSRRVSDGANDASCVVPSLSTVRVVVAPDSEVATSAALEDNSVVRDWAATVEIEALPVTFALRLAPTSNSTATSLDAACTETAVEPDVIETLAAVFAGPPGSLTWSGPSGTWSKIVRTPNAPRTSSPVGSVKDEARIFPACDTDHVVSSARTVSVIVDVLSVVPNGAENFAVRAEKGVMSILPDVPDQASVSVTWFSAL